MKGFRFKELVEASSSFFLAETNNSERIFNTVNLSKYRIIYL